MISSYFCYFIDSVEYFKLLISQQIPFTTGFGVFYSNAINEIIVTSVLRPVLEELQKYPLAQKFHFAHRPLSSPH